MDKSKRSHRNIQGHESQAFTIPVRVRERTQLERAAQLLRGKNKVTILAGAGARGAREELIALSEKLKAPIVNAMLGKDCVPDDHPNVTGGIGVVGTRPSVEAMKNCER